MMEGKLRNLLAEVVQEFPVCIGKNIREDYLFFSQAPSFFSECYQNFPLFRARLEIEFAQIKETKRDCIKHIFKDLFGNSFCFIYLRKEDLLLIVGGYKTKALSFRIEDQIFLDGEELRDYIELPIEKEKHIMKQYHNILSKVQNLVFSEEEALFHRIDELLKTNLSKQYSMAELEKEFYYSKGVIQRIIKKHAKKSFREHYLSVRMEKGKELLEAKRYTHDEISVRLGYAHRESFYKAFENYHGYFPRSKL